MKAGLVTAIRKSSWLTWPVCSHRRKRRKLCFFRKVLLPVNIFIWAWRVCCVAFWLVRDVLTAPPLKGVAYMISDWLMQILEVGGHCDSEWEGGVAVRRRDVWIAVTLQLVTWSHMWSWVRRSSEVFCYILVFFCCFENCFIFSFLFPFPVSPSLCGERNVKREMFGWTWK
jgi:hypothetical protein